MNGVCFIREIAVFGEIPKIFPESKDPQEVKMSYSDSIGLYKGGNSLSLTRSVTMCSIMHCFHGKTYELVAIGNLKHVYVKVYLFN